MKRIGIVGAGITGPAAREGGSPHLRSIAARALPRAPGRGPRARLRSALHLYVGSLARLLRGGVSRAVPRRLSARADEKQQRAHALQRAVGATAGGRRIRRRVTRMRRPSAAAPLTPRP